MISTYEELLQYVRKLEKDSHLYQLTLYFSDTNFTALVNDCGKFNINENYSFINYNNTYALSDELTESLINILKKVTVGNYDGINFNVVSDTTILYSNQSKDSPMEIYFEDTNNSSNALQVNLESKQVIKGNGEDWFIKITKLF